MVQPLLRPVIGASEHVRFARSLGEQAIWIRADTYPDDIEPACVPAGSNGDVARPGSTGMPFHGLDEVIEIAVILANGRAQTFFFLGHCVVTVSRHETVAAQETSVRFRVGCHERVGRRPNNG